MQNRIFHDYTFGDQERKEFDHDGHFVLPKLLTNDAQEQLSEALDRIESLIPAGKNGYEPNRFAAEFDWYLESLIPHPQMLKLARQVLGEEIRYDHCVSLNRPGGNGGIGWHSHGYSEDDQRYGYIRIFFYVNGFDSDDGGLKDNTLAAIFIVILKYRLQQMKHFKQDGCQTRLIQKTGEPLEIQKLSVPSGTVVLMWTHAAHAVTPRKQESDTRWTVVYGYYKPGKDPGVRWISPEFEQKKFPGEEDLMSPY